MGPRKILVVEDSELLHRMYNVMCIRYMNHGAQVLHSYNGQEALAKLAQEPDVDLIILDINMPVMSGLEFLQHRQRVGIFQDIPVIIISTEGKEEDTLRGLKAGARGYLTKPFQANDFHRLIERVFLSARMSEEMASASLRVDR